MNSTGSPAPVVSYSRSTSSRWAVCMVSSPGFAMHGHLRRRDGCCYGRNNRGLRRSAMAHAGGTDVAATARRLASRGAWAEAFERLMSLDADGLLDPADLPFLADVAYAAGHLDVTITVWER